MATYFIGDIQGCFDEFELLLQKLAFCPTKDTLYLAGDLIGRGPKSLETLAFVSKHRDIIFPVLGNHDLHFLAIANGIKRAKPSDRFEALLASPKLSEYVDYLRQQPLLIHLPQHNIVLSHAGITPQWDLCSAKQSAAMVEQYLQSNSYCHLLEQMYQIRGDDWDQANSKLEQMVFAINALTRMRYCHDDGRLDFTEKMAPPCTINASLSPWYQHPTRLGDDHRVLFGHWASLMGKTNSPQRIGLDTGCLWGNHLSAWQLENQQLTTVASLAK